MVPRECPQALVFMHVKRVNMITTLSSRRPAFAIWVGHPRLTKPHRKHRMTRPQTVIFSFKGPMGVRVDVDQSLMFLVALLVWFNLNTDLVYAIMVPVLLVAAIFAHELGHAWGNQVQDIPVHKVVMHGGGGYCQAKRSGTAYEAELIVAMGPIVNAALWAICSLVAYWTPIYWDISWIEAGGLAQETLYFVWLFGQINLLLLVFNMIPVQPLDGGKLFHLVMLRLMPADTAQSVTGAVGLVCAILWIPAMLVLFYYQGLILFFLPSIAAHYRMMRGAAVY